MNQRDEEIEAIVFDSGCSELITRVRGKLRSLL